MPLQLYSPPGSTRQAQTPGTLEDILARGAAILGRAPDVNPPAAASSSSGQSYGALSSSAPTKVTQHAQYINAAAKKYGIPANIIAGVIMVESGGNGRAVGAQTKYGQAKGVMQIMPMHWKPGEDPFDLATNIDRGASILKSLYDRNGGNWANALAAYNGTKGTAKGTAYYNKVMNYVNSWGGVNASSPSSSDVGTKAASNSAAFKAIATAEKQLGKKYVFGSTPASYSTGFDCSSLTQYAYAQAGIKIPRLAYQQYNATQKIDVSQMKPGDLIFFKDTYNSRASYKDNVKNISHVGIYVGNGQFVNASGADLPGGGMRGVVKDKFDLNSAYFKQHFVGVGRVQGSGAENATGSTPSAPETRGLTGIDKIFPGLF